MNFPIHLRSHYSIGRAFGHVDKLVKRAYELKIPALALTDIHSVSGCPEFLRQIDLANSSGEHTIKPIIGCDFQIEKYGLLTVLCANKEGWQNLVRIISQTKIVDGIDQITWGDVIRHQEGLIFLVGGHESILYSPRFDIDRLDDLDPNNVYGLNDEGLSDIQRVGEVVGDHKIITNRIIYYPNPDDFICQQIIFASENKTTLDQIQEECQEHPDIKIVTENKWFLQGDATDVPDFLNRIETFSITQKPKIPQISEDPDERLRQLCRDGWTAKNLNASKNKQVYVDRIKEELDVFKTGGLANYILIILDMIEYARKHNVKTNLRGSAAGCLISYLIGISDVDPVIPDATLDYHPGRSLVFERFYNSSRNQPPTISFPGFPYDEWLKSADLGRQVVRTTPKGASPRCTEEIDIFDQMVGGWLYLQDYINRPEGPDKANPSNSHLLHHLKAVGSLQENEPVVHTKGNYSLPDIDLDIEPSFRQLMINYLKEKYGESCVANIITFGTLDGKGAVKEVFRTLGRGFDIANDVSKDIIDSAKVSDVLQDLKEDDPDYNIIQYSIEHSEAANQTYHDYKHEFDLAIRIAGTIVQRGKHAAGIVLADEPLEGWIPTIPDPKSKGNYVVALDMQNAEACGAVKYDILGVAGLEKISRVYDMVANGLREPRVGDNFYES